MDTLAHLDGLPINTRMTSTPAHLDGLPKNTQMTSTLAHLDELPKNTQMTSTPAHLDGQPKNTRMTSTPARSTISHYTDKINALFSKSVGGKASNDDSSRWLSSITQRDAEASGKPRKFNIVCDD